MCHATTLVYIYPRRPCRDNLVQNHPDEHERHPETQPVLPKLAVLCTSYFCRTTENVFLIVALLQAAGREPHASAHVAYIVRLPELNLQHANPTRFDHEEPQLES